LDEPIFYAQAVEPTIVALVGIGYLQRQHLNTNWLEMIIMRKPSGKAAPTPEFLTDSFMVSTFQPCVSANETKPNFKVWHMNDCCTADSRPSEQ